MSRLIDADVLERDGWRMSRTVQINEKTMELQTRKPTDFPTISPAQQWIPCSKILPKDDIEVIVSCTCDSGDSEFSYTTTGWHFKGVWIVDNERNYFVRAWMPLPKSYSERRHE